ncbi:MAG TPA: glycoside hydrolase family 38 C-terminal domain-containing protein, partial [Gemmatimonadaceae bacterium]|nr:glycoside hydrolase family 38 C-terminal domain-containing protein [Gemmatimonadaceae bacterium]
MRILSLRSIAAVALSASLAAPVIAQQVHPAGTDRKPRALTMTLPDVTKTPSIFTMSYAHLDTEWNWDYVATIGQYLPKTMHENFDLFAKYPDYIFNFSGANRYRLMKEYYPAAYDTLKAYVAAGRWFPAGSSMEEGDVNAPSPEGILRQFLYGNEYFRKEFGKASDEYMLPDCFGFPWSLPSLLAHAGIKGFSTQKLVWGSSVPAQPSTPYAEENRGIPFNYGWWQGPDGKGVILAANPGTYGGKLNADWSTGEQLDNSIPGGRNGPPQQTWNSRLEENKKKLGGFVTDYHYLGTGDTGGSPGEPTVNWLQQAINNAAAHVQVLSTNADQFFNVFTPEQVKRMPVYSGEMELTNHSAGSLTSESYIKRWIRRNEVLADAAEKASVAAMWQGSRAYPMDRLNLAWTLAMGDHFHDIGAGTASVRAYEYAWNDQSIELNQFAHVLTSATEAVSGAMNTAVQGTPVVVYNSLSIPREDIVTASVPLGGVAAKSVHVFSPAGSEVPAQLQSVNGDMATILFSAFLPSVGYGVFDVRLSASASSASSSLKVSNGSLENDRYRVSINAAGDVASIFDKKLNKELLSAPARLGFLSDTPSQWPAWNMDFDDAQAPPRYLTGTPRITVVENGPARIAVRVERSTPRSKFAQTVRLSAGDAGNRVEFDNAIDWREDSAVVKAVFPLTASNDTATYNWGVGTIRRSTMYDRKFEVPSHQWIDLTDKGGAFGATILTDAKNGSDKPDANTIRLSLINSPGIPGGPTGGYSYQAWQDWGHHDILYGLSGHAGDFRDGQTDWQGMRLDVPLVAFNAPKHDGALGKTFSLVSVSNPRVQVMALKRAELSDEVIVRLNELDGRAQQNVELKFASPVTAAREVDGQERALGAATTRAGSLVTSFTPFAIHTFAVKLGAPASRA